MKDKFSAVWVSHSSISDFLECPRAYYLKNVYKDPKTNKKITLMSPALALGQAVHDTLESLSALPVSERFAVPIMERFDASWKKVAGKLGGFLSEETERTYKRRGEEMMSRVYNHPGPIGNLAVKITQDLPYFWLSEEENIILCGKVDWLEYLPEQDAVHIIDFKTGKQQEKESSLQLPIYALLVAKCQSRTVAKASYWYLAYDDVLTEQTLPDIVEAEKQVLEIAQQIKLARQLKRFSCPDGGCRACDPYERILAGEGEFVGENQYRAQMYILPPKQAVEQQSVIL
jgi:RecB family exonuclease